MASSERALGCEACFPPSAEKAWEARARLRFVSDLVDESHYHVMVLACPGCEQRFVSVFTETIDWQDGDDPQYWQLQPITGEEADALGRSPSLDEALAALPSRRSLQVARPKGSETCISWSEGIAVGYHD
jgi:hypothetical protein